MNKEKQIEEMADLERLLRIRRMDIEKQGCDIWALIKKTESEEQSIADYLIGQGYRKASEVAEEIFAEIDAHFDRRIALYQTMKSRAFLVGNEVEREYDDTMIINLTIYKKEIAELKKKYTEEEG